VDGVMIKLLCVRQGDIVFFKILRRIHFL
jgi:hypothetical protein